MAAPIPVKSKSLLLFAKKIVKKCNNLYLGLLTQSSGGQSPIGLVPLLFLEAEVAKALYLWKDIKPAWLWERNLSVGVLLFVKLLSVGMLSVCEAAVCSDNTVCGNDVCL